MDMFVGGFADALVGVVGWIGVRLEGGLEGFAIGDRISHVLNLIFPARAYRLASEDSSPRSHMP